MLHFDLTLMSDEFAMIIRDSQKWNQQKLSKRKNSI